MVELGIAIGFKSGRGSLIFDFQKIDQFKAIHGSELFVKEGCDYVERRCRELGITEDLWLWLEAVRANK